MAHISILSGWLESSEEMEEMLCVPNGSRCAGTVEMILELSYLAKQNYFLGREYIIPRN